MIRFKALRSSLIGLPVLSLLLVLIVGSLQVAVSLLLSSILCTLGIALVFWWLAAWLIGKVILAVYQVVTQGWRRGEIASATLLNNDLTPQQQAVIAYIQTMVAAARGDRTAHHPATTEQINEQLQQAGWSLVEIQAAYDWIEQQHQSFTGGAE